MKFTRERICADSHLHKLLYFIIFWLLHFRYLLLNLPGVY